MKSFSELANEYAKLDKRSVGYLPLYEMLFTPIRMEAKKILEIGVQSGKSITLLRDFFENAQIHGWDIDPSCRRNDNRISIDILNHDNKCDVISNLEKIGNDIDIIIDDGSHRMNSQQCLLAWCLKYVKSGGIYVTEDIGTSFHVMGKNYGLNHNGSNST